MTKTVNTIFRWCNDVSPMRHFYSECLNLEETFYENSEAHGWLTYQIGDVQLVFTRSDQPMPVETNFAKNPGYPGGTAVADSWVIKVNRAEFQAIVTKLQASTYKAYQNEVTSIRPGHLQYLVLDPMGLTIEIYCDGDET